MITISWGRLVALGAVGALALPGVVVGQRKARAGTASYQIYTISGINAWNAAKTQGFTFQPLTYASGQTVTSPRDGVNTRLTMVAQIAFKKTTVTLAQVVGGNASVVRPNSGSRTVRFEFFGGRTLAPGWSVESVQLTGSYAWDRQVVAGGQDLSFRVRATSYATTTGSAIIRSVTLKGPPGAQWTDAFVGRRQWTVTGINAWGTAKTYGFEFKPVAYSTSIPGVTGLSVMGATDGVNTQLITDFIFPSGACEVFARSGIRSRCVVAKVVGGNAIVNPPVSSGQAAQPVEFMLFGNMRLGPGWTVKSVRVSSGTFVRQPVADSDRLEFVLRVTSNQSRPASAYVTSVVLEGPSTASSWQEAFSTGFGYYGGGASSVAPPPPPPELDASSR